MTKSLYAALVVAVMVCLGVADAGERYESIQIANGLAHAEKGDWVLLKMADGKLQKHTIIDRQGEGPEADVSIQIVDFTGNTPTHSRSLKQKAGKPFVEPPPPDDDKKYTYERRKETVNYDGSAMEVTIVDVFAGNDRVRTWYLSTEFPVYGVIKRMTGNATDFELLDYGISDTAADPYLLSKPQAAATEAPAAAPAAAAK